MRELDPSPAATAASTPVPPDAPSCLRLQADVRAALTTAARTALPAEACGVLFGTKDDSAVHVVEAVPLPNRAADLCRSFVIDPLDLATTLAVRERDGLAWLGFFHSHPRGGAELSVVDRAQGWPHCVQLVVAADTDDVRAHWIDSHATVRSVPMLDEERS